MPMSFNTHPSPNPLCTLLCAIRHHTFHSQPHTHVRCTHTALIKLHLHPCVNRPSGRHADHAHVYNPTLTLTLPHLSTRWLRGEQQPASAASALQPRAALRYTGPPGCRSLRRPVAPAAARRVPSCAAARPPPGRQKGNVFRPLWGMGSTLPDAWLHQ